MLDFTVLGPLGVYRDGTTLTPSQPILRRLLAVMMCCAGAPVTADRLATLLWTNDLPRSAHKTLQVHVHRLRGMLGPERIQHSAAGYRIVVEPSEVDALRFSGLVARGRAARRSGDLRQAHLLLGQALRLWDGEPYAGVSGDGIVADEARRLSDHHLTVTDEACEVGLDLGRHAELIGELEQLARDHPYRERFRAFLMLALHRLGRRSEALGVFRDTRSRLTTELGVEPGPALQRLHEAILRADERLNTPHWHQLDEPASPAGRPSTTPYRRPRQLPGAVAGFTGRVEQLRRLDGMLDQKDAGPIAVLTGLPGVGKTTLALHWAQRVADRFPDGQLYVNLRGFHPSSRPVPPAEALDGFLEALGVTVGELPGTVEAKAGLYRSLLADRRVLVLADNARNSDQLRALLPGTPGSMLLATSRDPLTGLIATEAAQPVTLDALTRHEARSLVANRLGTRRTVRAAAVDDLVDSCAGHPLALAVLSARAAAHPGIDLEVLATQMRTARTGTTVLDVFGCDDAMGDVRTSFSWSSRLLSPDAVTLFRSLGRLPHDVFSASDLAGRAGQPSELVRVGLITADTPDRYRTSPLVRAYAAEHPIPTPRREGAP